MKKDETGHVLFFKISLPKDVFGRKYMFHVSSFLLQEDQDSGLNFNIEVSTFDDTTTKCQTVIC